MSHLFRYTILDVTLRLRVDSPALLSLAEALHSSNCRGNTECDAHEPAEIIWSKNDKAESLLAITGESDATVVSDASLFFLSEHRLTQLFAERLQDYLQIHAASVVDPQGNGWLISGPSRAGKTSLTLAFILSGWRWLSDEYALFRQEDTETILGFPRNFNLKETSFPIYPETASQPHSVEFFSNGRQLLVRFLDPLDIAPKSWMPQARMKGLIFPRWEPDLKEPVIRPTSGVSAAQVLLGETANWRPWALDMITRICRDIPVLEYRYTNPRAIDALKNALARY